jgi:hypothetical protein
VAFSLSTPAPGCYHERTMSPLLLLLAVPAAAEPPTKAALAVLRTYCVSCHGDKPKHASLNVLDRKALFAKRLVVPGKPDASELVLLLDAGTMPPTGQPRPTKAQRDTLRDWIAAGAPEEPPPPPAIVTGEAYILGEIARDWDANKSPLARYVTLDHLLIGPGGPKRLADGRKELQRIVAQFTKAGKPAFKLTAIDRQQSVFRLDLDALGWDVKPFKDSDLNAFDLLLLDYPYGFVPLKEPKFARVVPMLRATKPVRPLTHVRGDWLAAVLTDDQVRERDLCEEVWALVKGDVMPAIDPPDKEVWAREVTLPQIPREIGGEVKVETLEAALKAAGLDDLIDGKPVRRYEWDAAFPRVIRSLGLGEPVLPLDGLHADVAGGSVKVGVITQDDASFANTFSFAPGARLAVLLRPDGNAHCEVVVRHRKTGRMAVFDPAARYRGKVELRLPRAGKAAWDLGKEEEDVDVIVYSAADDGKSRTPVGVRLESKNREAVRDRVLHPLYQISEDAKSLAGFPPDRVGRHTTTISVTKP